MSDFSYRRLSAKLVLRSGYYTTMDPAPTHGHWCPACQTIHDFAVESPFYNGAQWSFDGNAEAPTFRPSMNIKVGPFPEDSERPGRIKICHYLLHSGRIQFLADCTHAFAGKTIELPDIPADTLRWSEEVKT